MSLFQRKSREPQYLTSEEKVRYVANMADGDIFPEAFRNDNDMSVIRDLAQYVLRLEDRIRDLETIAMAAATRSQLRFDDHYDPDLAQAYREGGILEYERLRKTICQCGHERADHMAATGALGSFGGSACNECWGCATFTP